MTAAWRAALEDARKARVTSPAQAVWDSQFARWVRVALRTGRTSEAAVEIAKTRTEDQYGKRPSNEETT